MHVVGHDGGDLGFHTTWVDGVRYESLFSVILHQEVVEPDLSCFAALVGTGSVAGILF